MPTAQDNGDGTYTVTREDGASYRSPIVPEGVGLEPVAPQDVAPPSAPAETTDLPPAPPTPAQPGPGIVGEQRDKLNGRLFYQVRGADGQVSAVPAEWMTGAGVDAWQRKMRGEGPAQPLAKDDATPLGNVSPAVALATARDRGQPTGYEEGQPGGAFRVGGAQGMVAPSGIGPGGQPAGAPAGPGGEPEKQGPKLEDFFGKKPPEASSASSSQSSSLTMPAVPSFRPAGAGEGMRELARAKALQTQAVAASAAVAQQHAAAEEAAVDEHLSAARRRELQAAALEEKRARSMDEADGEVRAAMAQLQRPTGELDAGRWWNSRTTGQKVSALVAGFLSGMVNDVDPIKAAQEQDLAIQRDAYERTDKANRARVEGATQLYGMMRQRFQDVESAQRAAEERAAAYTVLEGKRIAARFAGPEAQAMAQERLGQLEQVHAEKRQAMRDTAADRAARAFEMQLKWEEHQADMLSRMQKTNGGHPVPAEQAARISGFDNAAGRLSELEKAYHEKTGIFSGFAQHLPGTDASKYVDQKKVAAQGIGYIMEGGKLTESDLERYLDMLPNPGDSTARAAGKFENIRKDLVGRKLAELEGLGKAGYNVAGFANDVRPASFRAQ